MHSVVFSASTGNSGQTGLLGFSSNCSMRAEFMQSDWTVLCFVKLNIVNGKHNGHSAKLKLQVSQKNPVNV